MIEGSALLDFMMKPSLETNLETFFLLCLSIVVIAIAASDSLLVVLVLSSVFSMIMATLYLLMSAPDVAMTEAAIGACISTAFIIKIIQYAKPENRTWHTKLRFQNIYHFLIMLLVAIIFIYSFMGLEEYGNANNRVNIYLAKDYLANTKNEIGIPSVVAAILASYRGYDTLGETLVIMIAGVIIYFLLANTKKISNEIDDSEVKIERTSLWLTPYTRRILLPIIIILCFYIQVHGEISPGGGFQAGAILASAYIFFYLLNSEKENNYMKLINRLFKLSVLGFSLYLATGIITMLCGGVFLEYDVLSGLVVGQKIGIFTIEIGVGITVFSVMLMIFLIFEQTLKTEILDGRE